MSSDNNLEEKPISTDDTINLEVKETKPDATAILLSKLEDMEKRLQEAQQPKPKAKRKPSQLQLDNLKKAREKKLEMDAKKKEVKKQMKAQEKKIIKEKIEEPEPPSTRTAPIPIPQMLPSNPLDNYRVAQRRRRR